jgi:hypothetical protein
LSLTKGVLPIASELSSYTCIVISLLNIFIFNSVTLIGTPSISNCSAYFLNIYQTTTGPINIIDT